jgi:VWFA-related protein
MFMLLLSIFGARQPPEKQQLQPALTVRTAVNLVQTDVMVFDRQGRFVPGLKQDQFELEVGGKRQTVSFFELVASGSGQDDAAWASKTGPANLPVRLEAGGADIGRRLIFFVDDWHISADSLGRTRAALDHLIDTAVGVSDVAGIFPASGSIGFLQQLTDNRSVLHAAVAKLTFFNAPIVDSEQQVPMNEAQAEAINRNNQEVIDYFVDTILKMSTTRISRSTIEKIVRGRALALARQATEIAGRTLSSLARVLRIFAPMPGRKIVLFLSDGFVLQTENVEILRKIREATDTAARAGIVIYSLDTRGLIVGGPDASNPVRPDTSGRLARNVASEVMSAWDALNALAADTGGSFLKNTNALDAAIAKIMDETSQYYLLGWYLDRNLLEPGKYRSIRVNIKDRPDLTVRVRQAKIDLVQLAIQGQNGAIMAMPAEANPSEALLQLLRSPLPVGVLPLSFYAGYDLKSEKGFHLAIALQTAIEDVADAAGKPGGERRIDLAGIVSNTNGETVTSFSDALTVPALAPNQPAGFSREWIYSGAIPVKPGIYQVRVAVRDSSTGHSASSLQWLEVPDLAPGKTGLGSVFMSEAGANQSGAAAPRPDIFDGNSISIKRRFQKSSQVSYFLHVYNLDNTALLVQRNVYRGNQLVSQSPFEQLNTPDSAANSPTLVSGRLPLEQLPPGAYVLEILVKDTSGKPPATRQIHFWVQ